MFAPELLRVGANARQIQELLGHTDFDSTQLTRGAARELLGTVKRLCLAGAGRVLARRGVFPEQLRFDFRCPSRPTRPLLCLALRATNTCSHQ